MVAFPKKEAVMHALYFILFFLSAACFALAAFGVRTAKTNLLAIGLLFWVSVSVVQALQKL